LSVVPDDPATNVAASTKLFNLVLVIESALAKVCPLERMAMDYICVIVCLLVFVASTAIEITLGLPTAADPTIFDRIVNRP